jgi:DNA modification methylase
MKKFCHPISFAVENAMTNLAFEGKEIDNRAVVKTYQSEIKFGDCATVLKEYPADTFDLIVTSPPYADKRKDTYGGVPPDKYVEWFLRCC